MRLKRPRWFFLAIILTATIGAGLADVLFSDLVPLRPYTATFNTTPITAIGRSSSIVVDVAMVTLFILLVVSLVRALGNQTTGIVIAHSGFTPNPNVTQSPGVSGTLPLYPLLVAFIGLIVAWKYLHRSDQGI